MSEEKKPAVHPTTTALAESLMELTSPEGIQKYFLGYKKDGNPRAVYDVVKDFVHTDKTKKKKKKDKKKKDKKSNDSVYSFYLNSKGKKKGKKKKKKKSHWHFEDF